MKKYINGGIGMLLSFMFIAILDNTSTASWFYLCDEEDPR